MITHKICIALFFVLIMITSSYAAAENYYVTIEGKSSYPIKLVSNEPTDIWVQTQINNRLVIEKYDLEGELSLNIKNMWPEAEWVQIKTRTPITLTYHSKPIRADLNQNPSWNFSKPIYGPVKIKLSNISPLNEDTEVFFITNTGIKKFNLFIPRYKTEVISFDETEKIYSIQVKSPERTQGVVMSPTEYYFPEYSNAILTPSLQKRYFLVEHYLRNGDSFVVALDDPHLIENATRQILYPDQFMGRILLGVVNYTNKNHNRNFASNSSSSPWSWHISKVLGFGELASQECDGSPQYLEERVEPYIEHIQNICFWSYKVTKELSHSEVASGNLSLEY